MHSSATTWSFMPRTKVRARALGSCRWLTPLPPALDDKLGTLKVVVSRATDPVQDPSLAAPKPIVGKDGNTGSFGFTTEAQGEYRFCFTLTQPAHPQSEVEVDFDLKVGYEVRVVSCFSPLS